jgi:hypothetical protein
VTRKAPRAFQIKLVILRAAVFAERRTSVLAGSLYSDGRLHRSFVGSPRLRGLRCLRMTKLSALNPICQFLLSRTYRDNDRTTDSDSASLTMFLINAGATLR